MHIAICDDNVADRKQLERLLGRESDKRAAQTGVFYTDSYGVGEKLFPKRMSYDLFFIDIASDLENGLDYALKLSHEGGVSMPIVLCSSSVNYEAEAAKRDDVPANILYINKPILKAELSDVLDKAIIIEASKEKTIELRHQTDTYYVKEDDLVYAEQKGLYIVAHLKDGTEVSVLDNLDNFLSMLNAFTHFTMTSTKHVVNVKYVDKYSPLKIVLKDGTKLPSSLYASHALKGMIEK